MDEILDQAIGFAKARDGTLKLVKSYRRHDVFKSSRTINEIIEKLQAEAADLQIDARAQISKALAVHPKLFPLVKELIAEVKKIRKDCDKKIKKTFQERGILEATDRNAQARQIIEIIINTKNAINIDYGLLDRALEITRTIKKFFQPNPIAQSPLCENEAKPLQDLGTAIIVIEALKKKVHLEVLSREIDNSIEWLNAYLKGAQSVKTD